MAFATVWMVMLRVEGGGGGFDGVAGAGGGGVNTVDTRLLTSGEWVAGEWRMSGW